MGREKPVDVGCALREPVNIVLEKLILIFLHHGVEPVTIVVQEDAKNGDTS